ncbi:hypothetical protein GCM10029978_045230 [Actinoallomurus acanthiterrae]
MAGASARRAERTRERAVAALRRMDATGRRFTFDAVARHAGVSRSWQYAEDDLRPQIERYDSGTPTASASPPLRQHASDVLLLAPERLDDRDRRGGPRMIPGATACVYSG